MPIGMNHETKNVNAHQEIILQTGSIFGSARSSAPIGYLFCDGSAVSRTTYADLFLAINTAYGIGNGSTTFNLPDMRGAVPRGAGISSGYTQNVTVTLGAKDNDTMQGHTHNYYDDWFNALMGSASGGYTFLGVNNTQYRSTEGSSGRVSDETKMKNLGVNFFIKF